MQLKKLKKGKTPIEEVLSSVRDSEDLKEPEEEIKRNDEKSNNINGENAEAKKEDDEPEDEMKSKDKDKDGKKKGDAKGKDKGKKGKKRR